MLGCKAADSVDKLRSPAQPCLQGIADILYTVSRLLCLQELLAPAFIGLQTLLMGKNDLFLAFTGP